MKPGVEFSSGWFCLQQAGRHGAAIDLPAQSSNWHVACALGNLGEVARLQGDYALARQHTEEALAISREVEDAMSMAVGANNLSNLTIHAGLLPEAQSLIAEAIRIARRSGSITWLVGAAGTLAFLRVAQGRIDEALAILGLA